ncbi:PAS domain S-box protein [Stappia stellulata]|uniref:PAS domain S-box protein n=1 Tax=Stappia stellulata TaxID=71235 RepID=UPI001CD5D547|nr:PAS domain S-box protein [Stappia stellulata]MCA1240973.1 PAS domain S-box protein [Stappia stellulata]
MASAPTRPTVRTAVLIAGVLALCAAAIWVVVDHMRVDLINEANQVLEARLRMAERHGLYHTVSRDAKEQPPGGEADGADDAPDVDVAMRILYSVEPRRPQIPSPPQDDALSRARAALFERQEGVFSTSARRDGGIDLFMAVPLEHTRGCLACHGAGGMAAGQPERLQWEVPEGVGMLVGRSRIGDLSLRAEDTIELSAVTAALTSIFLLGILLNRQRRQSEMATLKTGAAQAEVRRLEDLANAQRETRERDARLRTVVESIGEGLLIYDTQGVIESANPAANRIFGHERAGLAGRSVISLFATPGHVEPIAFHLFPSPSDSEPLSQTMEFDGLRLDGGRVPVELAVNSVQTAKARLYVAVVRNISRRKDTERQLRQAQERLRGAIEALPDAFVLYDADDRLVICNQRYRDLYSLSAEAIRPGQQFEEMLRYGVALGQYADALQDPEGWIAERLRLHRSPPSQPIEQHLGDGRWLRVFERRMPDGQTVGFRIDITELKRREEALRKSEGQLRAVVGGALDAIVVVNAEGDILEFNPAAERVFGYARADVMGVAARGLLVPERHRRAYDEQIRSVLQAPHLDTEGVRIEARALTRDGGEILMEVAFNSVLGENGPVIIAFMRDITQERAKTVALEEARVQAEEADRAKSDFLAMMSHEIRTPLNAVLGLLDLLLHTPLQPDQKRHTETARDAALALLQILNDVLDFSRLEARRLAFFDAPFDPAALVEAVRALFAAKVAEKGLFLDVNVAPDVPDGLVGDAGRIRQVLINLVANAVKFTPHGGVSVKVGLRKTAAEDASNLIPLLIEVEDTGVGISGTDPAKVFSRFVTSREGTGSRGEGVGLGLAISLELTEGMGGSLSLQPREGGGSRFLVSLDLARADALEVSGTETEDRAPDYRVLHGAMILLAEDNATNRMMTGHLLDRWGCRYSTAETGREVLDRLQHDVFDAVLMDVSMPEMDGIEATRRIRAGEGGHETTPIVALTAHALVEERDKALEAGMNAFVTKPVDAAALRRTLAEVLGGGAPGRERWLSPASQAERTLQDTLFDDEKLQPLDRDLPPDLRDNIYARCVIDLRAQADRLATTEDPATTAAASHVIGSLAATFGANGVSEKAVAQERAAARTPVDPDFRAGVELLVEEVRRLADALDARRTSVADGD